MKFQFPDYWGAVLFALILTGSGSCTKDVPCDIDTDSALMAEKFYEDYLNVFDRLKRARSIMLDNELEVLEAGSGTNISANPLLLSGDPLDYADFSIASKGVLTVVKGKPGSR